MSDLGAFQGGHFCHQKEKKMASTDRPYFEVRSSVKQSFFFRARGLSHNFLKYAQTSILTPRTHHHIMHYNKG